MNTIALISCVKKKSGAKTAARDMYISPLFKKSLEYVETVIKPNKCFILSAKYGLLPLDQEIEPYDLTLSRNVKKKDGGMGAKERKAWADKVWTQLQNACDVSNDKFVFLAGKKYYKDLIGRIRHYCILMEGKRNGERLHWLNEELSKRSGK